MAAVIAERVVHCRSDAASLWPLLVDTERMNRVIGLESVTYSPLSDDSAARYLARTHLGGFEVEYEERPYEWDYLERFGVERRMRKGPARSLKATTWLSPGADGGTEVKIRLEVDLRFGILLPIARVQTNRSINRTVAEIERVDRNLVNGAAAAAEIPRTPPDAERLQRGIEKLRQVALPAIVERLAEHLTQANDVVVMRLRPHVLADAWGQDRRAVLVTLLEAVNLGLLELRWELVCPSCQAPSDSVSALAALKDHGVCQFCELEFELDLDAAVEATFAPARSLRAIDSQPYCIGGPHRTPHVYSQAILPSGGSAILKAPMAVGRYRLFVRGGRSAELVVAEEGPSSAEVAVGDTGLGAAEVRVGGGGRVRVTNPGARERHAKIEALEWTRQAATAFELSTLPLFRRLFSTDLLRLGAALKVAQVSIFFSDLTDSTQLYSSVGDGEAFNLVQKHFRVVTGLVEKNRGALVKTIGDAVMAVFGQEEDAVRASRDILDAFEEFRASEPHGSRTHIKLGVYTGPCFAMTANGVLDYFGQTVNLAARLQSQASSGELAVASSVADRAVEKGILTPANVRGRSLVALKGVAELLEVAKVSLHGARLAAVAPRVKTGT